MPRLQHHFSTIISFQRFLILQQAMRQSFFIFYMSDCNKIRKRLKLDRVPHLCSQYYGCKSHQGRGVESLRNSPKITKKNADWDVKPQLKPNKESNSGVLPYNKNVTYSAFAGSGSLLLMRGFQIFAKRK